MRIEQGQIQLRLGQKAEYEYDLETDMLEVFFQNREATAALELTESIILRFDWEHDEPLSLSFMGASKLIASTEYGEPDYQLLVDAWPVQAEEKVWRMLRSSPVNEFLLLRSYAAAHTVQAIPVVTVNRHALAPLLRETVM